MFPPNPNQEQPQGFSFGFGSHVGGGARSDHLGDFDHQTYGHQAQPRSRGSHFQQQERHFPHGQQPQSHNRSTELISQVHDRYVIASERHSQEYPMATEQQQPQADMIIRSPLRVIGDQITRNVPSLYNNHTGSQYNDWPATSGFGGQRRGGVPQQFEQNTAGLRGHDSSMAGGFYQPSQTSDYLPEDSFRPYTEREFAALTSQQGTPFEFDLPLPPLPIPQSTDDDAEDMMVDSGSENECPNGQVMRGRDSNNRRSRVNWRGDRARYQSTGGTPGAGYGSFSSSNAQSSAFLSGDQERRFGRDLDRQQFYDEALVSRFEVESTAMVNDTTQSNEFALQSGNNSTAEYRSEMDTLGLAIRHQSQTLTHQSGTMRHQSQTMRDQSQTMRHQSETMRQQSVTASQALSEQWRSINRQMDTGMARQQIINRHGERMHERNIMNNEERARRTSTFMGNTYGNGGS